MIPARTKMALAPWVILFVLVYGVLDDRGVLERKAEASTGQAAPSTAARREIPARYLRLYRKAGAKYGVRWALLAAVGRVESGHGRNMGPSSAGALGPMQFMPGTWRSWGRGGNVQRPEDAIPAAARFLHALGINKRPAWALAAYNAGPGRADHPPTSTRRYVRNVLALARRYQKG